MTATAVRSGHALVREPRFTLPAWLRSRRGAAQPAGERPAPAGSAGTAQDGHPRQPLADQPGEWMPPFDGASGTGQPFAVRYPGVPTEPFRVPMEPDDTLADLRTGAPRPYMQQRPASPPLSGSTALGFRSAQHEYAVFYRSRVAAGAYEDVDAFAGEAEARMYSSLAASERRTRNRIAAGWSACLDLFITGGRGQA